MKTEIAAITTKSSTQVSSNNQGESYTKGKMKSREGFSHDSRQNTLQLDLSVELLTACYAFITKRISVLNEPEFR